MEQRRYRGAKGGRGAAKSHFWCELLVEEMLTEHHRVACLREVQSSIKDSVKQLVEDKIKGLGVESSFKITEQEIVGPNDSLMVFRGLKNHTASSIKSLEGFTRAFVEEAQTITQRSLDILTPTIRAPGSALYFGWNPLSLKDPVDAFFEANKNDPDFVLVAVTYRDNPWFPPELRRDMERDRTRDPEKYQHVWLGSYQKNSEARVFRNWKIDSFAAPKGARPYYGGDWGFAIDPTVLVRCWIVGRTLYIDQEAYEVGCPIDKTPALFDKVEGSRKWPITADSARPEVIDYMKRIGGFPHIQAARKGPGSLEDGIEFLKSYDIIVHPNCKHVIDELSSYSYKTDKLTGEILPVLDDKKNHTIDACIAEGQLVTCAHGNIPVERIKVGDLVLTRSGYRSVIFSGVTGFDRETVRVETTKGAVTCTPDHRIYTGRGFVRADALRYDDEIINVEQGSWWNALNGMAAFIGATLKANVRLIGCTFADRVRGGLSSFIERCGRLRMVQFLQVTTSTISMAILPITTYPICGVFRSRSTRQSTHSTHRALSGNAITLSGSVRSPKLGTPALKDWRSTGRLGLSLMRTLSLFRSPANSAATSSRRGPQETETGSAVTTANQRGAAPRNSMTLTDHVRLAASSFASIATRKSRLVRGCVLTVSAGKRAERVYDLTVEGQPEFLAGGVLVHNCRYAAEQVRAFDGGTVYATPTDEFMVNGRAAY